MTTPAQLPPHNPVTNGSDCLEHPRDSQQSLTRLLGNLLQRIEELERKLERLETDLGISG